MIGRNVRRIRAERGMSLRTLAAMSGLTAGHLSRVERGLANLDQRRSLLDVAEALRVAPNELTGQPYDPQTKQEQAIRVAVTDLRDVLYGLSADGAPDQDQRPARDLPALRQATERVDVLHADCALDTLGPLLPDLLTDLYGHAAGSDAAARREALTLLPVGLHAASDLAHWAGEAETAYRASEQSVSAAEQVDDPALLGYARFGMVHALGHVPGRFARRRAGQLAARGADDLQPHSAAGPGAEMYGMLHLIAAWSDLVNGTGRDVDARVAEAQATAARTGNGQAYRLWFGPANVGAWRVALAVERDEGGRVPALAEDVDLSALSVPERKAGHLINVGRGLAQNQATAPQAISAFRRARRLTPMRVRLNPHVREVTERLMYEVGGSKVRSFASWLGVIPR